MKKLFTLVVATGLFFTQAKAQLSLNVGDTAPDWTVTDAHGNSHNLYSITASGKTVLIDFFFTTCGPCQGVAPTITEFYNKYGCNDGDVFVISIDDRSSDADVLNFESSYSGTNPGPAVSGNDGGGDAVATAYGPSAFPTVCIIGTDNKVKNKDIWPISGIAEIEAAFASSNITITEQACTNSIKEETTLNEVSLYPNPTSDVANLSFTATEANEVEVNIYNLVGELVSTKTVFPTVGENVVEVSTADLTNGQYLVKVMADQKEFVSKTLSVIK